MDLINLSRDLLRCAKNGNCSLEKCSTLFDVTAQTVVDQLVDDTLKKTFWINVYNAFVLFEYRVTDTLDYSKKMVHLKDVKLSLDDIEHGILRKSKAKLALGYIDKFNVSKFEREARLDVLDFRIHFALNCGANSCPPIFVFSAHQLDEELDDVSKNYLQDTACFKKNHRLLQVPRFCLWFLKDFGGFSGILNMVKRYEVIAPDDFPKIGFLNYDWETNTNNFAIQLDA